MATTLPADRQSAARVPLRIDIANIVRTLMAHLLEIGRPAPPAELADRCRGSGLSTELAEFICTVPGSPMRLTDDRLVTYALDSCRAFSWPRICGGSVLRQLESERNGWLSLRIDCDLVPMKRKWCDLSGVEFMSAKRRSRLMYCNDNETNSKSLFSSRGIKECRYGGFILINVSAPLCALRLSKLRVSSLPAVYRRRSHRNHGGGLVGSLSPGSFGKLITKYEPTHADSNVGFSGLVPNTIPCFKDSKIIASADTMHCAVLESNNTETLNFLPLALTSDKMMGDEACTASTHGATATIFRSFSAADKTEVGDPHLKIFDISYVDMSFPHEVSKISPSAGGSQLVLLEIRENQINIDQPVQKGPRTTSVFSGITKESSQISSMKGRGFQIDNARVSITEVQKEMQREIQDTQQAAICHGFSKSQRLLCDKMKTSHKSKPPSVQKILLMPSQEILSKNANIMNKAFKKVHSVAEAPAHLEESDHANALTDQAKKNAISKTHLEMKTYPCFETFNVEEEEGSGGYGTVFKARRKIDNEIFAIKCPHQNAPRHHISNELSMLQRFRRKNFIIRLEDSFKYKDSHCFVLQHVVHDRPEVLKKEIDVSQLRWYAYCMFEALANLHKNGIVHRDIKPGNFLFSGEVNIGYLIDFNLAMGIATLRGSEDLWEVAKLHNQESAFPLELLDVKFLPSIKLRKWCQINSRRPSSFINEAPDALYDFLDKCLTVNPRLRISAEDALQHEFLTPCRDMLLQQKLLHLPQFS